MTVFTALAIFAHGQTTCRCFDAADLHDPMPTTLDVIVSQQLQHHASPVIPPQAARLLSLWWVVTDVANAGPTA